MWPSDLTGRAEVGGRDWEALGASPTETPASVGTYSGDTDSCLMDSCVGDTISILMWDGASASAPRIGVSAAEGALAGLVGAAKRAALLSAEGPRGVLAESALGP